MQYVQVVWETEVILLWKIYFRQRSTAFLLRCAEVLCRRYLCTSRYSLKVFSHNLITNVSEWNQCLFLSPTLYFCWLSAWIATFDSRLIHYRCPFRHFFSNFFSRCKRSKQHQYLSEKGSGSACSCSKWQHFPDCNPLHQALNLSAKTATVNL